MRIWYEVSDEGTDLSITRRIAPDGWSPEPYSRTYLTWADARGNAIDRQEWVLRTGQYDPAVGRPGPGLPPHWLNDQTAAAMRDFARGILDDLLECPDDEGGFDCFETLRRSRFRTDVNSVPKTEVMPGVNR